MGEIEDQARKQDLDDGLFTLRQYLTMQTLLATQTDIWTAIEAVNSTAIEHPEWDLDEIRTWGEWEAWDG